MIFHFFCKIYSSHFEKRTFLKCPFFKTEPISFSDFLGVPLIFSLNPGNLRLFYKITYIILDTICKLSCKSGCFTYIVFPVADTLSIRVIIWVLRVLNIMS
ncbi:hypothetical protein EB093_08015 [bacterium]|nr:hypothetical protein [bacterium]